MKQDMQIKTNRNSADMTAQMTLTHNEKNEALNSTARPRSGNVRISTAIPLDILKISTVTVPEEVAKNKNGTSFIGDQNPKSNLKELQNNNESKKSTEILSGGRSSLLVPRQKKTQTEHVNILATTRQDDIVQQIKEDPLENKSLLDNTSPVKKICEVEMPEIKIEWTQNALYMSNKSLYLPT